jgi:hypothetical protein
MKYAPLILTMLAVLPPAAAQSNTVTGHDISLANLGPLHYRAREGVYPNGRSAFAMQTTVCNTGLNQVNWLAAMNADHPFITFLVVRESNGRLEQISDRTYVKHSITSLNTPGCGACPPTPSTKLGVGCTDTYGIGLNSNSYHLGPPEEIDPWLAIWNPVCSHFDRGEPAVSAPQDCDGVRSLTQGMANALGPIGHSLQIDDDELEIPGAKYFHQGTYVVRGMAESTRDDDLGWRTFEPTWNAGTVEWDLITTTALVRSSVLQAWSGATVRSAANTGVNGRVYVGALPTQVPLGWHYEYALHNRDNSDGVDQVRIPLAPGAVVTAAGMRDIDGDPLNDWAASVSGGELVFSGTGNALAWNTIYNVWFDSNAAPATGSVTLEQVSALPDFAVADLPTPTGALASTAINYCTAGTSASGCTALLSSAGLPSASAPSGHVLSAANVEGSKDGQFFYGVNGRQAIAWGTGTSFRCVVPPTSRAGLISGGGTNGACDGSFAQDLNARWTAKPSHNPGAGATVNAQLWYRDPQNTSNQTTSFSDGLEFVVGP